jgi:hypothetical protein
LEFESWLGIGYGRGMENVDMNIIEVQQSGRYKLYDSFSFSMTFPKDDTHIGGSNDLNIVESKIDEQKVKVKYLRKFDTSDKWDKLIDPSKKDFLVLAWGKGSIYYHGSNYLTTYLIFDDLNTRKTNESSSEKNSAEVVYEFSFSFWNMHGITLTLTWTILIFLAYYPLKFHRHYKYSLPIHIFFSSLSFIITIIVLSMSLFKVIQNFNNFLPKRSYHVAFGILIFCLVISQVILGIFNLYFHNSGKKFKGTYFINYSRAKFFHKLVGKIIILLCYINMITGLVIYNSSLYL